LEAFVGKFEGTGFNTILRPQNGLTVSVLATTSSN
jgi:hypothetical protein